jgi:hypothetical protein
MHWNKPHPCSRNHLVVDRHVGNETTRFIQALPWQGGEQRQFSKAVRLGLVLAMFQDSSAKPLPCGGGSHKEGANPRSVSFGIKLPGRFDNALRVFVTAE